MAYPNHLIGTSSPLTPFPGSRETISTPGPTAFGHLSSVSGRGIHSGGGSATRALYQRVSTLSNDHIRRRTASERAAQHALRLYNLNLRRARGQRFFVHSRLGHAVIHSLAGTAGAVVALLVVYPLDKIRVQAQLQPGKRSSSPREAWQIFTRTLSAQGVRGLYSGLRGAVVGVGVCWSLFYFVYALLRKSHGRKSKEYRNIETLGICLIAGTVAAVVSNPIWVIIARRNTDAALGPKSSTCRALFRLIRQEGTEPLFAGLGHTLLLLLNPAVQFTVYEGFKIWLLESMARDSRPALGKLSHQRYSIPEPLTPSLPRRDGDDRDYTGVIPVVGSAVTRSNAASHHHSIWSRLRQILAFGSFKRRGPGLKTNNRARPERPQPPFSLLLPPQLSKRRKPKLTTRHYLIAGSLAKIVALLITYPLQVLKTRAEARHFKPGPAIKRISTSKETEFTHALGWLLETESLKELYAGFSSKLVISTITSALMFAAYEKLVVVLSKLPEVLRRPLPPGKISSTQRNTSKLRGRDFNGFD